MKCPILQAGRMLSELSSSGGVLVKGDMQGTLLTRHESSDCMTVQCEWYKRGCPAYPDWKSRKSEIKL
jgi:hypothetical protein